MVYIFLALFGLLYPLHSAQAVTIVQAEPIIGLPQDVQAFLGKENDCFILSEQPKPLNEQQKAIEKQLQCLNIACDRLSLFNAYKNDPKMIETIKNYNADLWHADVSRVYAGKECAFESSHDPVK